MLTLAQKIENRRAASKRATKKWKQEDPEGFRAYRKRAASKQTRKAKGLEDRRKSKLPISVRKEAELAWRREYARLKRESDPEYKTRHYLATRLWEALKGRGKKVSDTLSLLGMDLTEFQVYIRGQFRPGMSWENYGPVWHLDHVKPCASFDLTDPEQQKICFRWDNLQPLFAKENLQKSDKWKQPL